MGALRPVTMVVAAIAAILMVIAVNPWFTVDTAYKDLVAYAFWISSIVMIVLIYVDTRTRAETDQIEIEGPAITRFLFSNSRAGLIWLPIRLFLGFSWLAAGWHKATGTGWLDGGTVAPGLLGACGHRPRHRAARRSPTTGGGTSSSSSSTTTRTAGSPRSSRTARSSSVWV